MYTHTNSTRPNPPIPRVPMYVKSFKVKSLNSSKSCCSFWSLYKKHIIWKESIYGRLMVVLWWIWMCNRSSIFFVGFNSSNKLSEVTAYTQQRHIQYITKLRSPQKHYKLLYNDKVIRKCPHWNLVGAIHMNELI